MFNKPSFPQLNQKGMMELAQDIFSLKIPNIKNNQLPQDIINLIEVHRELAKSEDQEAFSHYIEDTLNSTFLNEQKKLNELKTTINKNSPEKIKNLYTVLSLQISCIFMFNNIEKYSHDFEDFKEYAENIQFIYSIDCSDNLDLVLKQFIVVYTRIFFDSIYLCLLPYINNVFKIIPMPGATENIIIGHLIFITSYAFYQANNLTLIQGDAIKEHLELIYRYIKNFNPNMQFTDKVLNVAELCATYSTNLCTAISVTMKEKPEFEDIILRMILILIALKSLFFKSSYDEVALLINAAMFNDQLDSDIEDELPKIPIDDYDEVIGLSESENSNEIFSFRMFEPPNILHFAECINAKNPFLCKFASVMDNLSDYFLDFAVNSMLNVSKPSVNYIAALISIIIKNRLSKDSLVKVLDSPLLVNNHLWNPNITMFNQENHCISCLRYELINFLKTVYFSGETKIVTKYIINLLLQVNEYPHIFSEILYFLSEAENGDQTLLERFLCVETKYITFVTVISRHIRTIELGYMNNAPLIKKVGSLTFRSINKTVALAKELSYTIFIDFKFVQDLVVLVKYKSMTYCISQIVQKIYINIIKQVPKKINNILKGITKILQNCIENIETSRYFCQQLLQVVFNTIITHGYYELFCQTNLMKFLVKAIDTEGLDRTTFSSILNVLHFATIGDPSNDLKIDFVNMAKIVDRYGIDDTLYQVLKNIISGNQAAFFSIKNKRSLPLMDSILRSKHKETFIMSIQGILNSSVVQCLICLRMGLCGLLLDYILEEDDESNINLLLSLFEQIVVTSCSRPVFYKFMRFLNSKDKNINFQKKISFLNTLIKLLDTQPEKESIKRLVPSSPSVQFKISQKSSLLQFSKKKHVMKIPPVQYKQFKDGVSFEFNILLSNFVCNNSISLIKLVEDETKKFFKVKLFKAKIAIVTNITTNSPNSLHLTIPNNKWISLAIILRMNYAEVLFDNESLGRMNYTFQKNFPEFDHCFVFKQSPIETVNEYVNVQLTDLRVQSPPNDPIMVYSTNYQKDKTLTNRVQSSFGNAVYCASFYPLVTPFQKVFLASKGNEILLYAFSNIDDATQEDKASQQFVNKLLEVICTCIKMGPSEQDKFQQLFGFEVISYVLTNQEHVILGLQEWETMNKIRDEIKKFHPGKNDQKLFKSFSKTLLLNFSIWEKSSILTIKEILMKWADYASDDYDSIAFNLFIKLSDILTIYMSLRDKLDSDILAIIKRLVSITCTQTFDDNTMKILFTVLKEAGNSLEELKAILGPISLNCTKDVIEKITLSIIGFDELINNTNPEIQCFIIKNFVTKSSLAIEAIYIHNFLSLTDMNETILPLFALFVGFDTSAKYSYIIASADEWVIRPQILPYLLACASNITEDKDDFFIQILSSNFSNGQINKELAKFHSMPLFSLTLLYYAFICNKCNDDQLYTAIQGFFFGNLSFLEDSLCALDMISYATGIFTRDQQHVIILAMIDFCMIHEDSIPQELVYIIFNFFVRVYEPIVNKMNFTFNDKKLEEFSLQQLIEIIMHKNYSDYQYVLTPFIMNGVWYDEDLIIKFVDLLIRKKSNIDITPIIFLVAYLVENSKKFDSNKYIDSLIEIYNKQTEVKLAPLIIVYFRDPSKLSDTKIKELASSTTHVKAFTNSCNLFDSIVKASHYAQHKNIEQQISEAFKSIPAVPKVPISTKGKLESEKIGNKYKRNWLILKSQLIYEGSPYISSLPNQNGSHYKRGDFFDYNFRPIVMKRNKKFNNHDDAALLRGTIKQNDMRPILPEFNIDPEEDKSSKFDVNSKALWSYPCEKIKLQKQTPGNFYVFSNNFKFVNEDKDVTKIKGVNVKDVFWCWIDQHPNAVQIFTWDNLCYLFKFGKKKSHKFVQKLKKCKMPNIRFFQESPPEIELQKNHITKDWVEHKMSTEEYLLWLNILSGRSFNNPKCYPIFPLLLLDTSREKFEPEDGNMYRDLGKNIAVISETNLKTLEDQAAALSMECGYSYLHSSLYSNAFSICYYLIRQEPFTTLHIKLQDGAFDISSRIFKSIPYISERTLSPLGYNRELVPELYFDDDCLCNDNAFNFGYTSDGKEVKDVDLPTWSSSCSDYIAKHREALESDYTSENIGKWIDLIWGVNQDGDAAFECNNTFSPDIYPDVWKRNEEGDLACYASLQTLGQVPQKLFWSLHPKRNPLHAKTDKGILVLSKIEAPVIAFKCCGSMITTIRVFCVLQNGHLLCLKTSGNNIPVEPKKTDRHITFPSDQELIAFSDDARPSCVFVSPKSVMPSFFDFEENIIITATSGPHLDEISAIATSGRYVLTGSQDALVALWEIKGLKLLTTLMAHNGPIACCAISASFGIAVTVSTNGSFVVSTLPHLEFLRKTALNIEGGEEPTHVIITHIMGYIIIIAGPWIMSFTVNGRKISQKKMNASIVDACSFQTLHYTDRIAVITEANQILFLEAHSLEEIKVLCKPKEKIIKIEFNPELRSLISATSSSLVYFFPVD